MKTSISRISISVILCIVSLTLGGCRTLMYAKVPDLHNSKWESITVEYLVNTDSGQQRKTWSTADQSVLYQLQQSLKITRSGDLWGYGTMTSNKSDLELADGRKYVLHINSETQLCLNDYEMIKTGWGLDASPSFKNTLETQIESETKEDVHWFPQ